MKCVIAFRVLAGLAFVHCTAALAQTWPAKPIRLVLPVGPGSGVETTARLVTGKMTESLGQPMILDFHGGAAGQIGAEMVARAAPDGYTLLYTINAPILERPVVAKNVPYDPVADFTPITALTKSYALLLANPGVPAASLKELIEYARRNPGKLAYGTNGVGTSFHMVGDQLRRLAGVEMLHVPYKSGAPALTAAITGEVQLLLSSSGTSVPSVRAGKLRALAVFDNDRFAVLPDVPPITEVLPGFELMPGWTGMFGPARLPPEIAARVHREAARALAAPEVGGKLAAAGWKILATPPEEFAEQIKKEIAVVRRLAKAIGVEAQ